MENNVTCSAFRGDTWADRICIVYRYTLALA